MTFFSYENNTKKNLDEIINKLIVELKRIEMQIKTSQQYNIECQYENTHTKIKIF